MVLRARQICWRPTGCGLTSWTGNS